MVWLGLIWMLLLVLHVHWRLLRLLELLFVLIDVVHVLILSVLSMLLLGLLVAILYSVLWNLLIWVGLLVLIELLSKNISWLWSSLLPISLIWLLICWGPPCVNFPRMPVLFAPIGVLLCQVQMLSMLTHWLISAIRCILSHFHVTAVLLLGEAVIQTIIQAIRSIRIDCIHCGNNRILTSRIFSLYALQIWYGVTLWNFVYLFLRIDDLVLYLFLKVLAGVDELFLTLGYEFFVVCIWRLVSMLLLRLMGMEDDRHVLRSVCAHPTVVLQISWSWIYRDCLPRLSLHAPTARRWFAWIVL